MTSIAKFGWLGTEASRWRVNLMSFVWLFASWNLAIIAPLLDSLSRGSTYFVVNGIGDLRIYVFVAMWAILPPLAFAAFNFCVSLVSPVVSRGLIVVEVGALLSLWLVGLLPGFRSLSWPVFILLALALCGGVGFLLLRFPLMRAFVAWLSLGAVISVVLFLRSAPISAMLNPDSAEKGEISNNGTAVVQLIFDELSLSTILRPDGSINEALFPNFTRLSEQSTWYPNAKSLDAFTNNIVPAINTGKFPDSESAPSAAAWPESIFSLIHAGGGPVYADESWTQLCSEDICGSRESKSWGSIVQSTWNIALNSVLPDSAATTLASELGNDWGSESDSFKSLMNAFKEKKATDGSPANNVSWFREAVSQSDGPGLFYLHLMLPHGPFDYLPNGTSYGPNSHPNWLNKTNNGPDPAGEFVMRQRVILQSMFADLLLGQVLDELERQSWFESSMLVVMSDHGLSVRSGESRRGKNRTTQAVVDDVMSIPLFIKYPKQVDGRVDLRDARLIDVFPTQVEVIGSRLPSSWQVDGTSLLSPDFPERPLWWNGKTSEFTPDPIASAARSWDLLGVDVMGGDIYSLGPSGALVGQSIRVDELESVAVMCAKEIQGRPYVDIESDWRPAYVRGAIGIPAGNWLLGVVNGVVAGSAPVIDDGKDTVIEMILDPMTFQSRNDLRFVVADGSGALRRIDCS